jgi:hypothetical protein
MQDQIEKWYDLCGRLAYYAKRHWGESTMEQFESAENLELNEQLKKLSDEIAQELDLRGLAFDHLLEFSRDPMRTLDQEHEWAMKEIERLKLRLRAEEHPLGLRLEGAYLTRGSESVKLVGDQLEFVHVVLKQPGIHKHDVLRALYKHEPLAKSDLLDATQSEVKLKLKRLKVVIKVVPPRSGKLDFAEV